MIRTATLADLDTLEGYAHAFYEASGYGDYLGYDADKMRTLLADMIAAEAATVLITEGGFTGAALTQLYFSTDWVAQELFWYLAPEQRGQGIGAQLRMALEDWARDQNARLFLMSSLDFGGDNQVADHYRAAGYMPVEHSFARVL